MKRKYISLEELEESIKKEPNILEKTRWFFEDVISKIKYWIAYVFVWIGLFIDYRGSWSAVVKSIKPIQIWEMESTVTEFMLPRIKEFIRSQKELPEDTWNRKYSSQKTWISELEAVQYFLETLHNTDLMYSDTFDEEKYDLGREKFGEIYESLWY